MALVWALVVLMAFAFGAAVDLGMALAWARARSTGDRGRVRAVFAWQLPVIAAMLCGVAWLLWFLYSGGRGPVAGAYAAWLAAFLAGYVCGTAVRWVVRLARAGTRRRG